jgi:hypothetical protein
VRQEEAEAPVTAGAVEVTLRIDPGDPIAGQAFRGDQLIASFGGWMELYAAIERAREDGSLFFDSVKEYGQRDEES